MLALFDEFLLGFANKLVGSSTGIGSIYVCSSPGIQSANVHFLIMNTERIDAYLVLCCSLTWWWASLSNALAQHSAGYYHTDFKLSLRAQIPNFQP